MSRIIIEVRDNPQNKNLEKIIKEIKSKMLDLGLIVTVKIEHD